MCKFDPPKNNDVIRVTVCIWHVRRLEKNGRKRWRRYDWKSNNGSNR